MLLSHFNNPNSTEGSSWTYFTNGGQATLNSYGLKESDPFDKMPKPHVDFYSSLLPFYEHDDYIVVHAGLRVNGTIDMNHQDIQDLLWIRVDWIFSESRWAGKTVYYGHTPSRFINGLKNEQKLIRGKKSIGIDTGCVFGGFLSAVCPQTNKLIQIQAKKAYL